MLYQPSYPQPYSSDIDATIQNNFTCYINAEGGTQVTAYTLKINNLDGTVVYTTDKTILTTPLYGESTLSVPVIASGMVNGGNYMWNITLFESTPDIWVTSNILQTGNTTTTIYLQPSYLLSVGQYIKIGAEIKQIATYDNSNGKATVSSAFSTAPSAGTYYTVYTDNVISPNYYFQARTTPTLVMNNLPYTSATQSGDAISVSDSAGQNLQSLVVNGTTPNPGTQTPSTPITLGKVGSAENVTVNGTSYPVGRDLYQWDTKDMVSGAVSVGHGLVDLGTLSWTYNSTKARFEAYIVNFYTATVAESKNKLICTKYTTDYNSWSDPTPNTKEIFGNRECIYIHDLDYTDAAAFKAAMSGVMLLYQLTTPTTTTDASQAISTPSGNMVVSSDSAVSPTLDVTYYTSTLVVTTKSYTFNATYTQAENVGWKYYQWSLYNSNGVVIEQSNEITTGAIQYTFDGLIDTTTYGIGLILENQDGVKLSVGIIYFTVDYASPSVTNVPTTNVLCDKDAIQLSWDKILVNAGIAEGTGTEPYYSLVADQPYTGGSSVQMESNSSHIYWYVGSSASPVDISLNSTTYLYWTTNDELFSGNIVLLTGVKSQLIAISLGAPSTCETGDRYYNTNTNLIYTAISTNTWGTTGETPNLSVIYYNLQDSISYIYNGSGMVSTTNGVPECTLSISTVSGSRRYKFAYAVWNGASTIYNTNPYLNTSTQWLLQSTTTPVFNTDNIWNDSAVWSDTAYWVDSYSVNDYWYKFALQSNALNITKIIKS
jgi:hypothetical protein